MGRIKVVNNITLDGVMQAPGGPDEDTRHGFAFGGWTRPYQNAVVAKKMGEMMTTAKGALLLGRRTYEHFYSFWPKQVNNPYTEHLNNTEKYVASTTLKAPLPWQNSVLLDGDASNAIATLKQKAGKDFTILGSGKLIASLMQKNLIDEYMLLVFPIVLGTGLRLFPEGVHTNLELTESLTTPTGVLINSYKTNPVI